MSASHAFRCSACDFHFLSGWSHHAGGCALICIHCAARFLARGGRSRWGASPDERLSIEHLIPASKRGGTRSLATGLFLTMIEAGDQKIEIGNRQFPTLRMQPAEFCCPCCQTEGAVKGHLMANDPCPQCHLGTIIDQGVIEH